MVEKGPMVVNVEPQVPPQPETPGTSANPQPVEAVEQTTEKTQSSSDLETEKKMSGAIDGEVTSATQTQGSEFTQNTKTRTKGQLPNYLSDKASWSMYFEGTQATDTASDVESEGANTRATQLSDFQGSETELSTSSRSTQSKTADVTKPVSVTSKSDSSSLE